MNTPNYDFIIGPTDTDSLSFCKKDMSPFSQEELDSLLKELNDLSPEFMEWESDGYWKSCVALKAKNYVLFDGKNKLTKGSAFKTATKELALKELMNNMVDEMLNDNNIQVLQSIYKKYVQEALNVQDISRWSTKKTISDKILAGKDPKNEVRKQELDIWKAIENEDDTQEGNKVYLYPVILGDVVTPGGVSAKTGKPLKDKVKTLTGLKLSKYWTNDHNVDHLVKRCYDTVKIFANVLDMDQFIDYSKKSNKHLLEELKQEVINLNISKLEIEDDESDESSEE